jgi:carbamoyl-phosphate synthase small subunit
MSSAYLILADGTVFKGESIGAAGTVIGETVFNTGMTGYEEVLTDPSYYGQIVTQTYPLIGNYGICGDAESRRSWVRGYIVRELCGEPSNYRCGGTLGDFLTAQGVVGLCGIDTRRLTRLIREHGVMNGAIAASLEDKDALLQKIRAYSVTDAVTSVTVGEKSVYGGEDASYSVALLDCGYKSNIVRSLVSLHCRVTVYPAMTDPGEIINAGHDGIMLSNGPGDPAENKALIANTAKLASCGLPVFGICLGHQILALAHGAKTGKLKYGHRGANHPVKDLESDRTYITSQNHGYAVLGDTLDKSVGAVSHVNLNDGTVEGIKYKNKPVFSVQFHPEASPGPHDSAYLFGEFISMMKKGGAR